MSSAGGSQKKRKSVVRRVSADTLEYVACHVDGKDVDMDGR